MNPHLISDSFVRYSRRIVVMMAGCFVIWVVSGIFWKLAVPDVARFKPQDTHWLTPLHSTTPVRHSMSELVLFDTVELDDSMNQGQASQQELQLESDTLSSLRETRLSISLYAVMASSDRKYSGAIIESSGKQALYFVGDTLPAQGQVIVNDVFDKTVVLNNNGALEKLVLDDDLSVGSTVLISGGAKVGTSDEPVEKAFDLNDLVSVIPVVSNGAVAGLRIRSFADERISMMVDLLPGDIIVKINGISIASVDSEIELAEALASSEQMSLTIERKGQEKSVSFNTKLFQSIH